MTMYVFTSILRRCFHAVTSVFQIFYILTNLPSIPNPAGLSSPKRAQLTLGVGQKIYEVLRFGTQYSKLHSLGGC